MPPKAVAALRSCDCTLLAWVHGNGAGKRLQTTGAWPVTDAMGGEEGSSRGWEHRPAPEVGNSSEMNVWPPYGMGAAKAGAPGSVPPALAASQRLCWVLLAASRRQEWVFFHHAFMNYNGSKRDPSSLPWG